MKQLFVTALAALSISAVNAQETKTEIFKVYGNCGMCEERIEIAAKIKGVAKADWNDETKMIEIVYDPAKTSLEKVHKAIATVGHDTDKETAPDAIYNKLPGCCKYERKADTGSNN
jgi:periplasmic mercuric ion binding protein